MRTEKKWSGGKGGISFGGCLSGLLGTFKMAAYVVGIITQMDQYS